MPETKKKKVKPIQFGKKLLANVRKSATTKRLLPPTKGTAATESSTAATRDAAKFGKAQLDKVKARVAEAKRQEEVEADLSETRSADDKAKRRKRLGSTLAGRRRLAAEDKASTARRARKSLRKAR